MPAAPASPDDVDIFLARLDHPRKDDIEAIRRAILAADPRIGEAIKWNAPSFHLGEHFATFKLRPAESVQVVLHTGAKKRDAPAAIEVADPEGWLRWAAPDRCLATFPPGEPIAARRDALTAIIRQWIAQLEPCRVGRMRSALRRPSVPGLVEDRD
jgi:hypothetical protein